MTAASGSPPALRAQLTEVLQKTEHPKRERARRGRALSVRFERGGGSVADLLAPNDRVPPGIVAAPVDEVAVAAVDRGGAVGRIAVVGRGRGGADGAERQAGRDARRH